MKKIVLISCAARKKDVSSKAKDLYESPLFKRSLAYAQCLEVDQIYILSAKHHLVPLDEVIEPYDLTLNTMPASEIYVWANQVLKQLETRADLKNDLFVFLAGEKYRRYLIPHMQHVDIPLKGLPIGKQMQRLDVLIKGCKHG